MQVGAVDQTGPIPIPSDASLADKSFKRLSIGFGMEPFTAPGQYPAHVDLSTSIGAQTIPATLVVLANAQVAVLPEQPVFTGVLPGIHDHDRGHRSQRRQCRGDGRVDSRMNRCSR